MGWQFPIQPKNFYSTPIQGVLSDYKSSHLCALGINHKNISK